jgi:hypothetical protein
MRVTPEMTEAARLAEYDYYQRNRLIGAGSLIPTPHAVIRLMLDGPARSAP